MCYSNHSTNSVSLRKITQFTNQIKSIKVSCAELNYRGLRIVIFHLEGKLQNLIYFFFYVAYMCARTKEDLGGGRFLIFL